jgi:hypothetical protein
VLVLAIRNKKKSRGPSIEAAREPNSLIVPSSERKCNPAVLMGQG